MSSTEILLVGSDSGRPEYDVFRYDTATRALANLTATPAVDDGGVCVYAGARHIAFRAGDEEQVARITDVLGPLPHARLPAFERCRWTSARTFVGVAHRGATYRLYECTLDEQETATCAARGALDGTDGVVDFIAMPAGLGVIARRPPDLFRAPFLFGDGGAGTALAALAAVPLPPGAHGDVLDLDDGIARWGFHSRYGSTRVADPAAVVSTARRIGDGYFGIVATAHAPRTLARADAGGWELLQHPSVRVPADVASPREIWMRGASGALYQAFYFGPPAPERVVVWWHGGPYENVSPRFNSYFLRLNQLGFGVLAVNYPGSTGRGVEYERRFDDERWLRDSAEAVWTYLRENETRVVVSWSVSTGNRMQAVLLRHDFPLSAVVDQAGWGRSTLLEDTRRRGIPFFAIRGRYDPRTPIAHVDYWYPGGHDITSADDFAALFAAVTPFLRSAHAIAYAPAPAAALTIDLPSHGSEAPPVDGEEEALGFELATVLARDCFPHGGVAFTANATAALDAARVRARIDEWRRRGGDSAFVRVRLRDNASTRLTNAASTSSDSPTRTTAAAARSADGGGPHRTPGVAGEPPVLHPVDLDDPDESVRVRDERVSRDGTIVHPRLESIAAALCPRLRALAPSPKSADAAR